VSERVLKEEEEDLREREKEGTNCESEKQT
jgi:hypothetical protein